MAGEKAHAEDSVEMAAVTKAWKLGDQYLPVTERLSVFAGGDPAGGSDVDLGPGKYGLYWSEGLVRLKA